MLELKNVTKIYNTGDFKQKALDNVSLVFREQEFASVLGPSGSGKTTLLNIIGGLDHYTSGDLVIDGTSTRRFKDANWDAYRNHRIGFVFQSYNLISHQSILNNVRLALTLSGISKREGNRRAKKALESVGLGEHIHKRPSQLSGGQMQRVAIARALVNDPDILLADEPTGALDSETSVQIMELLKNISKEKLVIMVTHNPELAEKYSTRIIELKDGKITKDSNVSKNLRKKKTDLEEKKRKSKKTKMSFLTALGLSFNNLLTKKGRTVLVAFAGSIGIIGIALILAVLTGFQNYVDSIQEDALDSYPLMITEESFSLDNLITTEDDIKDSNVTSLREKAKKDLAEFPVMANTLKSVATNDLKSFKKYYEAHAEELKDDVKTVTYGYDVVPYVYSIDATNTLAKLNPNDTFSSMFGAGLSTLTNFTGGSTSLYSPFYTDDRETILEKYDVLAGRLPENYDEVIINLASEGVISDLLAYELGLKDTAELSKLVESLISGESVEIDDDPLLLDYEDLLNLDLRVIIPSDLYKYNEKYDVYEDMSEDKEFLKDVYENKSIRLKVVGIISAKSGVSAQTLEQGVGYTSELVDETISRAGASEVVKKQLENKDRDIFSGSRFDEDSSFDYGFEELVSVDEEALASIFEVKLDENELQRRVAEYMAGIADSISVDISPANDALLSALDSLTSLLSEKISAYDLEHPLEPLEASDADAFVDEFLSEYAPSARLAKLEGEFVLPVEVFREIFAGTFKTVLPGFLQARTFNSALTLESLLELAKSRPEFSASFEEIAKMMTEAKIKKSVIGQVSELTAYLSDSFAKSFNVDASKFASAFRLNFSEDELMRVMKSLLNSSKTTLKSNLSSLGFQDKEDPSYLYFYFRSFDGKENFLDFIENYNDSVEKEKKINYSDMTGILMDSVKTIVNAVSYVLIAFVSISLVVSSIMIGIITYISVYERTKEIGILRAMGASKKNISSIFNAETFIIGLLSGIFGITISYLLLVPINALLNYFTNVANLRAALEPRSALVLVVLSVILTLIGGLIPARAAAKKDPVEALRTE
ncbi:ATP-binding cassette domain-containing protein [Candidatus Saccharibacteria bacterium]|nr:ATP-binding cassette domain-containing protein [Candidatus Saccharibacteria bacterium]